MKFRFALLIVTTLAASACTRPPGFTYDTGESLWPRNDGPSNRTFMGDLIYPKWLTVVPEHYEFTPLKSNFDPQNDHPAQWAGQDWDTAKWNTAWAPDMSMQRLFEARIFQEQYMEQSMPVLELGPTFYKLSDLDRRRALKLVADQSGVLKNGHEMITLRDWYTGETMGNYSEKGMFLK